MYIYIVPGNRILQWQSGQGGKRKPGGTIFRCIMPSSAVGTRRRSESKMQTHRQMYHPWQGNEFFDIGTPLLYKCGAKTNGASKEDKEQGDHARWRRQSDKQCPNQDKMRHRQMAKRDFRGRCSHMFRLAPSWFVWGLGEVALDLPNLHRLKGCELHS